MLPILSLLGLAVAAVFLPSPPAEADDPSDEEIQEVSDQRSASGATAAPTEASGQDLLNFEASQDEGASGADQDLAADAQDNVLTGTPDDDDIRGLDGADMLFGGAGEDTLYGGSGDDILFGDDDAEGDDLIGGDGNDVFHAGDQDNLTLGAGDDVIRVADSIAIYVDDFNPDDDRIEVIYERGNPAPTLETVPTNGGLLLKADDHLVAELRGITSLDLNQVKLIAA